MANKPVKKALNRKEMKKTKGGLGIGGSTDSTTGGSTTPPTPVDAEILSPRDPASGMPTGQRMHKPY